MQSIFQDVVGQLFQLGLGQERKQIGRGMPFKCWRQSNRSTVIRTLPARAGSAPAYSPRPRQRSPRRLLYCSLIASPSRRQAVPD
jgi:hypothetical protein